MDLRPWSRSTDDDAREGPVTTRMLSPWATTLETCLPWSSPNFVCGMLIVPNGSSEPHPRL